MNVRTIVFSLFSFALGASLFAVEAPMLRSTAAHSSPLNNEERAADKDAIRSHIDKIFKAYMQRDCATIRSTHAADWIGFTNRATSILRGIDAYMNSSAPNCINNTPVRLGISDFKITEIDYLFNGDVALVPYIAEVTYGKENPYTAKIKSLDVYAKTNGEWNQIGSNIGPHPDTIQAQIRQAQQPQFHQLNSDEMAQVLKAREAVWRAIFVNDRTVLESVIPTEAITIGPGEAWGNRAQVLSKAEEFAKAGGKLVRLEFPKTEVQAYGNVAILYSTFLYEFELGGKKTTNSGRATEVFVRRDGKFVNAGWHLDSGT